MKTNLTLLAICIATLFTLPLKAQKTSKISQDILVEAKNHKLYLTNNDTILVVTLRNSELTYTGLEALKKNRELERRKHWSWDSGKFMGINIMYNGLISNLGNLNLPSDAQYMTQSTKSIGVDINLIDGVLFSSGCFAIVSGLGLECNNFRFSNNISLTKDAKGYTVPDYSYDEHGIELSKSKLTTTYLNVPLLFQFKIKKSPYAYRSGCWISVGVVGGIKLQSYTKTKSSELGIVKDFNNQNISNFHFGFQASIGFYSGFNITAKYYPQSIFRNGYGPHVEQASIGIGFNF